MRTFMIALLATQLHVTPANAANEGGHGGGSIVCGNPDGSILSAELLDLWEKRLANDGSTVTPSDTPEAAQLEAALVKFAQVAPWEVERMRTVLAGLVTRDVSADEQLLPPRDTGLRTMRRLRNCSLQGVAEFDDTTGILTLDPEILGAMDNTNRAALKFHEALYKVWRGPQVSAPSSAAVRRVTGAVFADQPLGFVAPDADRARARYECNAGDLFRFLVVEQPGGALEMQFTRYAGRPTIGKMTARVAYDQTLTDWARSAIGWISENPREARTAVDNLRARLGDGFRHATVRARDGQADPSCYPPLPFHYEVALRARSDYEPDQGLAIWGGDFFTGRGEITRNHHVSFFSLTTRGLDSRRLQGVLECRRPWVR